MAELDGATLIYAVQAVNKEVRRQRASVHAEGEASDYQRLDDWETAAGDLERAYREAAAEEPGLPPYETLVRTRDG